MVTIDLSLPAVLLKQGTHREVGSDLGQVYHSWLHKLVVDTAAITMLRDIALSQLKSLQEMCFKVITEEFLRQLNCPPCILDNLHRLNAGQFIKKPATAGVHKHGMPLQLEKFECGNIFFLGQLASAVLF